MKGFRLSKPKCLPSGVLAILVICVSATASAGEDTSLSEQAGTEISIRWPELGVKATAQYSGNGLVLFSTPGGTVHLRCTFQRLEGEVTRDGLWLTSTAPSKVPDRVHVVADYVGCDGGAMIALPGNGKPLLEQGQASYVRKNLTEKYSVSVDGVRQDYVVSERPTGQGSLRVEMAISGARAKPASGGVNFTFEGSGRTVSYNRLHAMDATGHELNTRFEIVATNRLAIIVEDANAAYPVTVDPTFSDANWTSLGSLNGANGQVNVIAADGIGNVYIGGTFTIVGNALASSVAMWNGSNWSAVGSGLAGESTPIYAMTFWRSNLYIGGSFTVAAWSPSYQYCRLERNQLVSTRFRYKRNCSRADWQ